MNSIAFERYLQRMKMALSRDMSVLGLLYLGPVMDVPDDGTVRDLDFLLVVREGPVERYLEPTDWLPDYERVETQVSFGPGHRELLLDDGCLIRLSVRTPDGMTAGPLGPIRVLLDRGGIGRLARALSSAEPPDPRPPMPDGVTADHVAVLAWSARLFLDRGDDMRAERLIDHAVRAAASLVDDPAVADELRRLSGRSVSRAVPDLVDILIGRVSGDDRALRLIRPRVGGSRRESAKDEPRGPVAQSNDEPVRYDPETDVVGSDSVESAPNTRETDTVPGREAVLAGDACPFCGGRLAPPGRLYLKGTLKDIRFLEGLSSSLELKRKVLARPCTECGQISLRFQDD